MWQTLHLVAGTLAMVAAGVVATPAFSAATLTADRAFGTAPLSVTFTGDGGGATYFGGVRIEFGDGEDTPFCPPGRGCRAGTAVHNYAKAGAYEVRLIGQGEGTQTVLAKITILVD